MVTVTVLRENPPVSGYRIDLTTDDAAWLLTELASARKRWEMPIALGILHEKLLAAVGS